MSGDFFAFVFLNLFEVTPKSSVLLFLSSASFEDCCPPHCGSVIYLCVPTPGNCAGFKLDALYKSIIIVLRNF